MRPLYSSIVWRYPSEILCEHGTCRNIVCRIMEHPVFLSDTKNTDFLLRDSAVNGNMSACQKHFHIRLLIDHIIQPLSVLDLGETGVRSTLALLQRSMSKTKEPDSMHLYRSKKPFSIH